MWVITIYGHNGLSYPQCCKAMIIYLYDKYRYVSQCTYLIFSSYGCLIIIACSTSWLRSTIPTRDTEGILSRSLSWCPHLELYRSFVK